MFSIFKRYPELFIAFSEKKDGSMKILKDKEPMKKNESNRNIFLEKCGLGYENLISAEIVHGSNVQIIAKKDGGKIVSGTDGLITKSKDIYLSITSADCLPIFLFEPEKGIIGMIHAGWRSLEKNIIRNAARKMKDLGGKPENILAGVGPAICQKHYEIGPEVAKRFENYPETVKNGGDKIFLDIKKIAESQLLDSGIKKINIEISKECTFELPEKYFSARRDKPKTIEAMIAVIGIKKPYSF
ncbi:MAG: peptidoglycan editing factor PgeF [Parcubacteria group bacterium]|jgi:hypothetical protein